MSDLVPRLIAAGVEPALVAEVAMELGRLQGVAEAAGRPDKAAEKRRAYDRDRKRKAKPVSGGIPVVPVETAEPTPSPNDIYSNPQPQPLDISNEISPPIEIELSGEPPLSPEEILDAWNDTAGQLGLPKAKMTPLRRRKALTLIRQHAITDFTEAIDAIRRSPFLRGENGRSWRADFDFFLQPTSFTRMIEGSYDRAN